MGYFANMTEFELWAVNNCDKCVHYKDGCPVDDAHTLFAYELCNDEKHPGKIILNLLIPENADGVGNAPCAMFQRSDGISERQIADWNKYKAAMEEANA